MPPMGTMNSHTTELQTPELRPTGLAPQGTRPEGLVDSDSKSVAASPNLSMALKWPIMCWCAVKKLLTHSPNLGTGNRHVLGGWDRHNRFHKNPFRGFRATGGGGRNLYIPTTFTVLPHKPWQAMISPKSTISTTPACIHHPYWEWSN